MEILSICKCKTKAFREYLLNFETGFMWAEDHILRLFSD
jgi:hypothetical protein